MYVADILRVKGSKVITVPPELSIAHVAQRLRIERVGALVVSVTGATAEGIIRSGILPTALQNTAPKF